MSGKIPDRVYLSPDRQWAKSQTPICTEEYVRADLEADRITIDRLRQHVDDLQSGMYVNCVYCGHRYGPGATTPVSMADALKAHVEQCAEHPMSALKRENERLRAVLEETR